jgi:hypothetical protein
MLEHMKTMLRFLVWYVALSAILCGMVLLSSFPQRPSSWHGWLALFVLIIPITLVGEGVGELLRRNRVTRAVERRTQGSGFSWLRLGYFLVVGLLLAAGVFVINQAAPWRT